MSARLDELSTERINPRTADLDRLSTLEVLTRLNNEDQLVAPAVRRALPEIARAVDLASERWRRGGRVVLFGAGTSGRLATLDAAELRPTFGVAADRYAARLAGGPQALVKAVEGAEDDTAAGSEAASDLVAHDVGFGIAASGSTPWVVAALRRARSNRAATISLACVRDPVLAECADVSIVVETGPEAISGSTRLKAGTAQKLVLNAFSTALMVRLGKVYGNLMVDVRATNSKLRRRATRLVMQAARVDSSVAEQALRSSGWEVKVAIASLRLGIAADDARLRLAATEESLRAVLGEP